MSDSVWPHRWQPTRLPRPWGSPGKNTGVGCHFLLQCRKVKSESEVAQPSPILSDPMNCNLPGSSVHGISSDCLQWFWSPEKWSLPLFPFSPIYLPWSDSRATQDGKVVVESSDKMWSAGEGNGKPLHILALRTLWTVWNSKKTSKGVTLIWGIVWNQWGKNMLGED